MVMLSNKAAEDVSGGYIIEATVQNFMHEVIETSLQMPVVVYFTATWCTPCKQFGPTLEKVVNDAKGRLKLARVDIDKNPQLAQQFRIQSVPMVYIFVGGQPVDGFSGAMQESQLKQLFAQFMQATPEEEDAKEMLKQAEALLEAGEVQTAMRYFQAVLQMEPENIEAIAGLASAFISTGNLEQAEGLLNAVPEAQANHEAVSAAKARLALAKNAPKPEAVDKLYKALALNAADHQARCDLAAALYASGKSEEAIGELLKVIEADKSWNEGAARQQLLTIFEALGFEHPLAQAGRRKLSAILFK